MKPRLFTWILYNSLFCSLIALTQGVFLPSIQWTPENPLFNYLNGKVRKVQNNDRLNIWCPKDYSQLSQTNRQVQPAELYLALYKVETKAEYDECDATKGKRLLVCNDPEGINNKDEESHSLWFREIPLFDNMDPYPPGKTYYYIGTSGGRYNTLNNKNGGKCETHNLKFAIYVCKENEENCNVEVADGGWSLWRKNEMTGQCERNCTNPEPQNGGKPCTGPKELSCSKVITENEKEGSEEPTSKPATDFSTVLVTTAEPTTRRNPTTSNPTTRSEAEKNPLDDKRKDESDDVTLSMKGAVLTFIGLFILGCIVGIVQVLAILHLRSKRSTKQPASGGAREPVANV